MQNSAPNASAPQPAQLVPWVIWFAFLQGIVMFRIFLVRPLAPGALPPPDVFPWALSLVPVLFSIAVRWLWLPRTQQASQALAAMIVGIAFAEATTFFAIFLTPSKLNLLIAASFLGALQFAPFWASRFYSPQPEHPTENVIPRPPR